MKQQAAHIDMNEHNKFDANELKSQSNQTKKRKKEKNIHTYM